MNDSFDDNYMTMSHAERSQLIFEQLKNSYTFWSIRRSIKDEVVKQRTRTGDMGELIPKLLQELNLETKIKNKV